MNTAQATFLLFTMLAVSAIALAAVLAAIKHSATARAATDAVEAWQHALDEHLMWTMDRPDVTETLLNLQAMAGGAELQDRAASAGPWTPRALRDVLRLRNAPVLTRLTPTPDIRKKRVRVEGGSLRVPA